MIADRLRRSAERGKLASIIVVAEGEEAGGAFGLAERVNRIYECNYRVTVLGFVQRGGDPTARDRILASRLGSAAVEALISGESCSMIDEVRGQIERIPMSEAWERPKSPSEQILNLTHILAG